MTLDFIYIPNHENKHRIAQRPGMQRRELALWGNHPLLLHRSGLVVDVTTTLHQNNENGGSPQQNIELIGNQPIDSRLRESPSQNISSVHSEHSIAAIVSHFQTCPVDRLTDMLWRTTSQPTVEKVEAFLNTAIVSLCALPDGSDAKSHLEDKLRFAVCCEGICKLLHLSWNNPFLSQSEYTTYKKAVGEFSEEEKERKQLIEGWIAKTEQAHCMIHILLSLSQVEVATDGDIALVCEALFATGNNTKNNSRGGALWCLDTLTRSMKGRVKDGRQSISFLKIRQKILRAAKKKTDEETEEKQLLTKIGSAIMGMLHPDLRSELGKTEEWA